MAGNNSQSQPYAPYKPVDLSFAQQGGGALGQQSNMLNWGKTPSTAAIQQIQPLQLEPLQLQKGIGQAPAALPPTQFELLSKQLEEFKLQQARPPGTWEKGGTVDTGVGAAAALGNLWLSNESRKLGNKTYDRTNYVLDREFNTKGGLVNEEMYTQQVLKGRERGQSIEEANRNAESYVKDRGVQLEAKV